MPEERGLFDEYGREGLTAVSAALMVGKVIALGPFGALLAGAGLMTVLMGGKREKEARFQGQRGEGVARGRGLGHVA